MKYTGRIVATCLVIGTSAIEMISMFFAQRVFNPFDLYDPLLYLPISWWFGLQYDKAKFYSEKDALTGLFNRRFILQAFPKMLAWVDRKKSILGICIIDCNNFKNINDSRGHKVGDLVLKEIASKMNESVRDSDLISRFGGDEFLIIAPFTDRTGIEMIQKRITKKLEKLSDEMNLDITVSMGISIYPEDGDNLEDLIKIADAKMYQDKFKYRGEILTISKSLGNLPTS